MNVCRWIFYTMAFLNYAMSQYVRWIEGSRAEAGYWLATAAVDLLFAYIVFGTSRGRGPSGS